MVSDEEAEDEGSEVDEELSSKPGGGDNAPDDVSSTLDGEDKTHSSGYNLRKRKPINYGETRNYKTTATILYQHGEVSETSDRFVERLNEGKLLEPKNMFKRCVGICMNQMSAKAGIKKHGEEAVSAILKEFGQLEHMKTFRPENSYPGQ